LDILWGDLDFVNFAQFVEGFLSSCKLHVYVYL